MMEENQKDRQETELKTDSQTPEDGAREAMEMCVSPSITRRS